MADQSAMMQVPPGVDPIEYAKQMRQQRLADFLSQDALTPVQQQQPQGSNRGFYQAARTSPINGVAKLVEALMASKAMDTSSTNQAQMYAQALQSFNPNGAPPPPPAPANPGPMGGYSGGAGASDAGQPPAAIALPQSTPGQTAPPAVQRSASQPTTTNLNPMGLPPQLAMRMYMSDPSKYGELIAGTPEWRTALQANGGNPHAAMAQLQAKYAKEGTIDLKQGSEAYVPGVNGAPAQVLRAPVLGQDEDLIRDAQGNPIGTRLLPGATTAEAARNQAQTTGTNMGEIHEFDTGAGGKRYSFGLPQDLPGVPRQPYAPPPGAAQPPGMQSPPGMQPMPGAAPGASPPPPAPVGPKSYFPPSGGQSPPPPTPQKVPGGVTPGIWNGAPSRPSSNSIGEDPYLKGTVEQMVKKHAELADKYGSESDLADQRIAFNNEALRVLNSSETGPLSDQLTLIRKKAQEAGVPASWIPGSDTVNSTDELKKFLLRNPLLSLKPTFGGRPAASEFQVLANDASPSPQMMKGAIQRLVQLDNQSAGFSKQRAMDYGYYHDQLNGNPQRFESWYSNKVPFGQWLSEHPNGQQGQAHVDVLPTKTIGGVTYEQLGPGQWRPRQGGQ